MTKRIKSAIAGFLGTYTSRYSDWDGYWLFGFLIGEFDELEIDLLATPPESPPTSTPLDYATALARRKFQQQLRRNEIPRERVSAARLEMTPYSWFWRPSVQYDPYRTDRRGAGLQLSLLVRLTSGQTYATTSKLGVSPHDPEVFRRSSRRNGAVWHDEMTPEGLRAPTPGVSDLETDRSRDPAFQEQLRNRFVDELLRFQKWAAARSDHGPGWEAEYERWSALRRETRGVLELPYLREVTELLYVLARDHESGLVRQMLDEHPRHGMYLARHGFEYDEPEARWQLAEFLLGQSTDEARDLLQTYAWDRNRDDRVKRTARRAIEAPEGEPPQEGSADDWVSAALSDVGKFVRRFNWLNALDALVVLGIPAWVWAYSWYGLDVWFVAAGLLALVAYLTLRLGRQQLQGRERAEEPEETSTTPPCFDRLEEVLNWTLPGLTLYFRDADLAPEAIDMYQPGVVFRAKAFVDVSGIAGKPTKNTRFAIASSKAAPLYQVKPDTEKWRLHTLNCNSYFKVLDVTERDGVTQILLLHIPYAGIPIFRQSVLTFNDENVEQTVIERARNTLEQKWSTPENKALEDPEWTQRTKFAIGLTEGHTFFPLTPTKPVAAMARPLHDAIRKMTNDLGDVNDPFAPGASPLD